MTVSLTRLPASVGPASVVLTNVQPGAAITLLHSEVGEVRVTRAGNRIV